MASVYENLKNDRQYSASTGLNKAKFDELAIEFDKYYKPKNKHVAPNQKMIFQDSREALFFILYYLKTYPTLQVMGLQFDISDFAVSTYINYLLPFLKAALEAKSALVSRVFASQADFAKTFEGVRDIMIDCTEIPIERSDDENLQSKAFSGKKRPIPSFS